MSEFIYIVQAGDSAHFDRPQPVSLAAQGTSRNLFGTVAVDASVDLHAIPHFPAQQLVNRRAVVLALDIPQRLIDAGNRAHHHRAPAIESAAKQRLPNIFDLKRISPKQIIGHIFDSAAYRAGLPFNDRLAPAKVTFICRDFQK